MALLGAAALLPLASNTLAQDDSGVMAAIVVHLKENPRDLENMEEIWVRDGVFEVSRHRVDYSFGEPLREWSQSEKEALESTAADVDLSLRFCLEDCDEAPHTALTVAFGIVRLVSAEQAVVSIQVDAHAESRSWYTSYEMVLARSSEGNWTVAEARPGTHGDAVSCFELYGHSCDEEFGPTNR